MMRCEIYPHLKPIELCLKKLELNKEDVIYIGNALSEYQACINAGIDFAYAKWGSASTRESKLSLD